jgi:hypothetical protein
MGEDPHILTEDEMSITCSKTKILLASISGTQVKIPYSAMRGIRSRKHSTSITESAIEDCKDSREF